MDLQAEKTPLLQGFNLKNIVLPDNGLDLFCIDAPEHQVVFDMMLPITHKKLDGSADARTQ